MQGTAKAKPAFRGLKDLKKRRRVQVVVLTLLATVLCAVLVGFALKDGINLYRDPTQVLAEKPGPDEVFRLGGLVKEGSIVPGQGVRFSFTVTDGAEEVPVAYIGDDPRPDLFKEGTGTIATGTLQDGVFQATSLLTKHDETYMPKEVADSLKERGIYEGPEE